MICWLSYVMSISEIDLLVALNCIKCICVGDQKSSLLTVFSKIFENVIYKQLFDHLNNNVILNEHQYGFRSEVSTEKASYILQNEILTALNNKQMVGGIFCDLNKSFDY